MASAKVDPDSKATQVEVRIDIDHWSTDAERASVMKAVKNGGTPAVHAVLSKMKNAGTIQVGLKKVAIKYAYAHPTGGGRMPPAGSFASGGST